MCLKKQSSLQFFAFLRPFLFLIYPASQFFGRLTKTIVDTRRALDLEGHWSQESRPTARFSALEKLRKFDEDELDRLVDEFPIPSYYNPNSTQHIGMSDQTRSKSRNRFASNSSPSIQSSTNSVSRFPSQKSSLSYDKSRVKRPSNKR